MSYVIEEDREVCLELSAAAIDYIMDLLALYRNTRSKLRELGPANNRGAYHRPGTIIFGLIRPFAAQLRICPNPLVRHRVPFDSREYRVTIPGELFDDFTAIANAMPTTGDKASFLVECAVQFAMGESVILTEGTQ